jgi:hypothetical protein
MRYQRSLFLGLLPRGLLLGRGLQQLEAVGLSPGRMV